MKHKVTFQAFDEKNEPIGELETIEVNDYICSFQDGDNLGIFAPQQSANLMVRVSLGVQSFVVGALLEFLKNPIMGLIQFVMQGGGQQQGRIFVPNKRVSPDELRKIMKEKH